MIKQTCYTCLLCIPVLVRSTYIEIMSVEKGTISGISTRVIKDQHKIDEKCKMFLERAASRTERRVKEANNSRINPIVNECDN